MNISAIITAHCEGLLAGPSLKSFSEATEAARKAGLSVETIVVLDSPDQLTREIFEEHGACGAQVLIFDGADPGLSRNFGVSQAVGEHVAFLDADDLWSSNWLVKAHQFCTSEPGNLIAHSELNLIFGDRRCWWWHADSQSPEFDPSYLRIKNYWDALIFSRREILIQFPYRKNDLKAGYGYEDWDWNCITLGAGIPHRPVPGTVHMKRARRGSQSALCDENDVMTWPSEIQKYTWSLK